MRAFLALFLIALAVACGSPPATVLVVDQDEVEAHRLHAFAPIRDVPTCISDVNLEVAESGFGYAGVADIIVDVDRTGRARFSAVNGDAVLTRTHEPGCTASLANVVADWRYRPFARDGTPVAAQVLERVYVFPAERWETPRQAFPAVDDISEVRITLERDGGIIRCSNQSPYRLELSGGRAKYAEIVGVAEGPRHVFGATQERAVSDEQMTELLEQFRTLDFFSMPDEYMSGHSDGPSESVTLQIGEQQATVWSSFGEAAGMPVAMRDLFGNIDRVGGLQPWACDEYLRAPPPRYGKD